MRTLGRTRTVEALVRVTAGRLPPELAELLIVQPEPHGNLADHGVSNQLRQVVPVSRPGLEWAPEEHQPVGPMSLPGPCRARRFVQPEQHFVTAPQWVGRGYVGDRELDTVEVGKQCRREPSHRVVDQPVEPLSGRCAKPVAGSTTPVTAAAAVSRVAIVHAERG